MLPAVLLGGCRITRLICGGNPFSGFSHQSEEMDRQMVRFYTMPRLQETLRECQRNGINAVQTRGDRHMMRMIAEHRESGGTVNWIAQVASEFADHRANVREISKYSPIAVYYHGTYIDNLHHAGRIEEALPVLEYIKELGFAAGIGTHIPEVIIYCEENSWPVDFYMASFYNLAREPKPMVAVEPSPYRNDKFHEGDPLKMCSVIRQVRKPCLGFKILGCGKKCGSRRILKDTFRFAFDNIKDSDAVVVGMFQKNNDQVAENAEIVKEVLRGGT